MCHEYRKQNQLNLAKRARVRVRCVHSSFDSELKNKKSNYDDLFFFLLNIENKKIEKRCFIVSGHTKKEKMACLLIFLYSVNHS